MNFSPSSYLPIMYDFDDIFHHYPEYRVIICKKCHFSPVPDQVSTHLRTQHPRTTSEQRSRIVETVQKLPNLAWIESQVRYPRSFDKPIPHLPVYFDGLRCSKKEGGRGRCRYVCRTARGIRGHCEDKHQWVNQQKRGGNSRQKQMHPANKVWKCNRACQRFFKTGSWQRYFEVAAAKPSIDGREVNESKASFFREREQDLERAQEDAHEEANRVAGFDAHRSSVVPWLRTTGIVDHVRGLKKDEIQAAVALPTDGEDAVLHTLIEQMGMVLGTAHSWCFDGPDCMLTWPCRVVLSRFQSSQVEQLGSTRAFDPHKSPGALKAYFKLAKQFVVYMYRVVGNRGYHFSASEEEGTHRPEDVMEPSREQLMNWRRLGRLARDNGTTGDQTDDNGVQEELIKFWMLVVSHNTGTRRYRSPLLSFCALLAIDRSTAGWMAPGNFNSHLSGIIWVVQLLVFYDSAQKELRDEGDTLTLVKQCCERNLQQTVDTPMGEILRWRLLLFTVSMNTVGTHQATWDEDEEVLRYKDTELQMDHIPTLLGSEYHECRRFLYDDLMFANKSIRHMQASILKDNMDVHTVDWNFCQHRDNQTLLQGSDRILLSAIERSDVLCRLYLVERRAGGQQQMTWRETALASYESTVQEFLKRLAVLAHIEGGPPLRESEFFSVRWKNTQSLRSIYIHLKRVMIHTTYDKTQQQKGRLRDNIRFLSDPVAELLLDFLVYVMPLRQIFLRHSSPKALLSPYLWSQDGKVWPDSKLTRCLENASDRAQIPRLHIANWRQMTVAIVKTKFASQIGVFEIDPTDEDGEEMEDDIRILTRMRNHKVGTANRAYANQQGATFGNVWDGLVRMGHRASTLWQDFWGVNLILRDRKRPFNESTEPPLTKRLAMGVYRPRKPWSTEALLGGLRALYGNESMEWKSPEQEQALALIMGWTEQVVAILPTGAGKSLLFMLPCSLPGAGITVLVVPLVSLRSDLLRRLGELHVEHMVWSPGERREASLVLVSVEAAATADFRGYAQTLIDAQKLDRIVVDECHLTVTAVTYRESMVDLTAIRILRTQFVYLTATLPPSMQAEFEERNYLVHPKVIRASSNRPNISYTVRKAQTGRGSLLEQAAWEAQAMIARRNSFDRTRDKIVLYVRTRDEADDLAALIRCEVYTAKMGTAVEKSEVLERWIGSSDHTCIVATAALAEGFDYAHVRMVINVNEPDSIILFAQESGRAGRDGKPAYSLVLLPAKWDARNDLADGSDASSLPATHDSGLRRQRERRAMQLYLRREQCYRTSLTEYLDSPADRRWCMIGDIPCDFCQRTHDEPIGPPAEMEREGVPQETHTGAAAIHRARLSEQTELARYIEDMLAVRGSCMFCRAAGERWDHPFPMCHRRFEVFRLRDKARRRHTERGRRWLQPYTACFWCLNPQSVCSRADPEANEGKQKCDHADTVLPLCCGVYEGEGGQAWLHERFGRDFASIENYLDWLGEESRLGGGKAIQAVRVAAMRLGGYHLD